MLVFQMTMPVTLVAVLRVMPARPGLAFGLPCLALVAGALPTFYRQTQALFTPWTILGLTAVSGMCVWAALRMLGVARTKSTTALSRESRNGRAEGVPGDGLAEAM